MPPDEITLGEIARRLDRLDTHIAEALRDVVPKALYDAESRALRSDLDDLRRDVMNQAMTRRQLIAGALLLVLGQIFTTTLALFDLSTRFTGGN